MIDKVYKVLILIFLLQNELLADIGVLTRVVDGDTVYFKDIKCRLAYIDTPESKSNDKAQRDVSKCNSVMVSTEVEAGKLSSSYTSNMLKLGETYQYDVIDTDRYDRKVCLIQSKGFDVNLAIVAGGYAVPYYKYIKDKNLLRTYTTAKMDAKRKRLGLWGTYPSVMECMDESR